MNKVYRYIYADESLTSLNKSLSSNRPGTTLCAVCNTYVHYPKYVVFTRYMQTKTRINICTEKCKDIISISPTSIDTYLSYHGHKITDTHVDVHRYMVVYMDILP